MKQPRKFKDPASKRNMTCAWCKRVVRKNRGRPFCSDCFRQSARVRSVWARFDANGNETELWETVMRERGYSLSDWLAEWRARMRRKSGWEKNLRPRV